MCLEIYNVKTRLNESNILVAKSCIDGAGLGLFICAPMEVSSSSNIIMLVDSGITDECSRFLRQEEHKLVLYHSGTIAVLHVADASNHLESVSYTDTDIALLSADRITGVLEVANGFGLLRHQMKFGDTVYSVREKHQSAVELGQRVGLLFAA